ncbi:hypothetical protein [Kocuria palustris]|uniref:hypothetical protein n=1 Tax=Kocuria palustris TaxID=71999 RepID=UPI0012E73E67|nr:hypothetical protein [Kocuria palustris]
MKIDAPRRGAPRDPLEKLLTRSQYAINAQIADSRKILQKGLLREDRAFPIWPSTIPESQQQSLTVLSNWGIQVSATLLSNVLDHCLSLEQLIALGNLSRESLHAWSYLTLARVVVEAATTFCELSDPTISSESRVGRATATILAGRLAEIGHARAINSSNDDIIRFEEKLGTLKTQIRRAGFEIKHDRRGREIALLRSGEEYSIKSNITSKSKDWLVNSVAPYENGSAVTHSSWWFLLSTFNVKSREMVPAFDPNILVISVISCLDSLRAMAKNVAVDEMMDSSSRLEKKTYQRVQNIIDAGHGF